MDKELKENLDKIRILKGNLEDLDGKFRKLRGYKQSKADMGCDQEDMKSEIDYLYSMINSIRNYAYQLEGSFYSWAYNHEANHMPKLTASAMQKMLKVCGMDGDYEIKKPQIYITASKNGPTVELTYKGK